MYNHEGLSLGDGYRAALNSLPHNCPVCGEMVQYDQWDFIGRCDCGWNTEQGD